MKDERFEKLNAEEIPFYLSNLEAKAKKNDGHLAANTVKWCDVYSVAILEYCNSLLGRDIIAEYPNLKRVYEKIMAAEGVKKYMASRPEDRFPSFFL